MRLILIFFAALISIGTIVEAENREILGRGRLFTNDHIGDGRDRWRTGSYSYSIVRGVDWTGERSTEFGSLQEYRLRSEVITPRSLNGATSDDRAYVGALSAGFHTHFKRSGWDLSTGVDLVFVGPQTQLMGFQETVHDLLSMPNVSSSVEANQVGNAVYPTLVVEGSRVFSASNSLELRPFIDAQVGVEDFVRVGADVVIGAALSSDLWLRDSTTGQLYSGIEGGRGGIGIILGADYTFLDQSEYFPESFGTIAEDERVRFRAGMHSRLSEGSSFFYGLTYLGEEFEGQEESQVVGSLKLNFSF